MDLKYIDGLMGFAIGDALGIPLEKKSREELLDNPVTKMLGGGIYDLKPGTWSTNTSLVIATIDSINNKSTIDLNDIALNFVACKNHGHYTPFNEVYNLSENCRQAIDIYDEERCDPISCGSLELEDNDYSSLIRILPVAYYALEKKLKDYEIIELVKDVSSITNAQDISMMACYIFIRFTMFLLNGNDKLSAYSMSKCVDYSMFSEEAQEAFKRILKDDISKYKLSSIKSSSNVVDVLESVLWVFLQSGNYTESMIGAINLGDATSEIAALTGALSGITYGYQNIPDVWKETLLRREYLMDIFEEFSENKYNN